MKLTVGLNTGSVKKAVRELKTVRKKISRQMVRDLLVACCNQIKEHANANLDGLGLGANVINGIKSAWVSEVENNGKATLTNTWHSPHNGSEMAAAYVEFGVGLTGSGKPHEKAGEVGWQYNVPSPSKDDSGRWAFYTNLSDLDLPMGDYHVEKNLGGSLLVSSQGTGATRFLYNAVMEFINNDEAKTLWEQIKVKYWG